MMQYSKCLSLDGRRGILKTMLLHTNNGHCYDIMQNITGITQTNNLFVSLYICQFIRYLGKQCTLRSHCETPSMFNQCNTEQEVLYCTDNHNSVCYGSACRLSPHPTRLSPKASNQPETSADIDDTSGSQQGDEFCLDCQSLHFDKTAEY